MSGKRTRPEVVPENGDMTYNPSKLGRTDLVFGL